MKRKSNTTKTRQNTASTARKPATKSPHKLDLYRLAVQEPWSQVNWLVNAYAAHYPGRWARAFREDFAGASALAMAWVAHDHDHAAVAIDNHGPTVRFAQKRARALAKSQQLDTDRITIVQGDVMDKHIRPSTGQDENAKQSLPKADILAAFNFSINIYHDFASLVAYFKNARSNLTQEGLFVMDCYGGPGAWRVSTQHRRIRPPRHENISAFDYYWQQQDVDPLTGLVHCAIDFKTKDQGRINNAFVYHWRLWTLPELLEALKQAGLARTQVWCEVQDTDSDQDCQENEQFSQMTRSTAMLEPVDRIGPCEDFLAYITAEKSA